jgi:hypothetical protein
MNMRYFLSALLLYICANLYGQLHQVPLSEKHFQRLEHLNGRVRLLRYLSYYKKDSTRWARELEKSGLADIDTLMDLSRLQNSDSTIGIFDEFARKDLPSEVVPALPAENATLTQPLNNYYPAPNINANGIEQDTTFSVDKLLDSGIDKWQGNDQLLRAQRSVSTLLKRYREYANSDDLSHATRESSLAGQPWFNRVVAGLNFQMTSWEPLALDISPVFGYRITKRIQLGTGFNYRLFAEEHNPSTWSFSTRDYRLFTSYLATQSLFGLVEWEESKYKTIRDDDVDYRWRSNLNLGVGKKLLIHPKMYFTVTALYNVSPHADSDRFNVRLGFEVSELAIQQRRIRYDPNQR